MSQKSNQRSSAGGVQVFELTMDNPEDQDELNRRLRKPGEVEPSASAKNAQATHSASTEKESGRTKGSS